MSSASHRRNGNARLGISIEAATALVRDLFEPRLQRYWLDFLASWIIGAAAFITAGRLPLFSLAQVAAFAVAVLAFYRAAIFIHEIVHQRKREFRWFRGTWNLLCGVPLLMPYYTYEVHLEHHTHSMYGTAHDGEYTAWAHQPPLRLAQFFAGCLVLPLLGVVRFLLLTPCAWLSARIRDAVDRRASALVIDPAYKRRPPLPGEAASWRRQEALCFFYLVAVLVATVAGVLPLKHVIEGMLVLEGIALLNGFRVLGAHRYAGDGEPVTLVEQLLDSVNYPRRPLLTALWAPVGLRFHALHHLFPSLPYHALPEAHRRLMLELPAGSAYRDTISDSLFASLARLWQSSRRAAKRLKSGGNVHERKPNSAAKAASHTR